MKIAYIFDVDGTLTPSRKTIDPDFKSELMEFAKTHEFFIVTGSDKAKTVEQIGEDLFNMAKRSYNCSGNDVYEGNNNVYTNDWRLEEKPWKYLESKLLYSKFAPKTGWHFEERPGMLNFSILGRKANTQQREQYVEWDRTTHERRTIADEFNSLFHADGITAEIGGETGLDIYPIGCDKSQVLRDFDGYEMVFFGDRTQPGGNDYALANAIITQNRGAVFQVDDWKFTRAIVKNL